jgi:hypothetical protein
MPNILGVKNKLLQDTLIEAETLPERCDCLWGRQVAEQGQGWVSRKQPYQCEGDE